MSRHTWNDNSDDKDSEPVIITQLHNNIDNNAPIAQPDDNDEIVETTLRDNDGGNLENDDQEASSDIRGRDKSDSQVKDMISDLHNLLFFHGPAANDEIEEGDDGSSDDSNPAEVAVVHDNNIPVIEEDNLEESLS